MYGKQVLSQLSAYKQGMQIEEVKKKFNLERIVKLSSNENPYGYSNKVDEAISIHHLELYPDGYAYDLRLALCDKYDVTVDQLVLGAGSDDLITSICRAFLHEGTNTVMAKPTFSQYRQHALIEGASLKEVPTINGRHDLTNMANMIDNDTKIIWLCTPDNPSGALISEAEFHTFMEKVPQETLVVLDEAYIEYVEEKHHYHLHANLAKYKNLIVLRTFSKVYGLAGLRIGYGIMDPAIAELIEIVRGPFNTTSITQEAAIAALKDSDFVNQSARKNREVLHEFQTFLDSIGWTYYESHTNFLLVNVPIDADEFIQYLLEHGFIARSGNALGYENTVRITIGKKEDMKQLQTVIATFHEKRG